MDISEYLDEINFLLEEFHGDEEKCKMIEFTMMSIANQSGWEIERETIEPTDDMPTSEKEQYTPTTQINIVALGKEARTVQQWTTGKRSAAPERSEGSIDGVAY